MPSPPGTGRRRRPGVPESGREFGPFLVDDAHAKGRNRPADREQPFRAVPVTKDAFGPDHHLGGGQADVHLHGVR